MAPRDFAPSKAIQIYMKPGIKEDALMLSVWDACRRIHRPQDVFRSMLRAGLIAMVESGEMPESVIEECGLDSLVSKRRRRLNASAGAAAYQPPYPFPVSPAMLAPFQALGEGMPVPRGHAPQPGAEAREALPEAAAPARDDAPPSQAPEPRPPAAETAAQPPAAPEAARETAQPASPPGKKRRIGKLM